MKKTFRPNANLRDELVRELRDLDAASAGEA